MTAPLLSITAVVCTDLHIYILYAVPPVHVVSNHVDTDKLSSLPLQMAELLRRAQPVSVANHVKARQSDRACCIVIGY